MDFFKKYRIKGETESFSSFEEFQKLRVGVIIQKNTGEEFVKTAEDVFDKYEHYMLDANEINSKFARLDRANVFTVPQETTSTSFTKGTQLVSKKYVDDNIQAAKINTANFARTDQPNTFNEIQSCAETPTKRQHITNKAYVDDAINSLSFDTSQLAKLNQSNVFTEAQICAVTPTEGSHLANKTYVDSTVANINADLSHYIRDDQENEFTEVQTFDSQIVAKATPTADYNVVNLKFLNSKLTTLKSDMSDFASRTKGNDFAGTNTFNDEVIVNTAPVLRAHVATKGYVDDQIQGMGLDSTNIVYKNTDNEFAGSNTFNGIVAVPTPTTTNSAATKKYVDDNIATLKTNTTANVANATFKAAGKVMLSSDIANATSASSKVPTDYYVKEYVKNSVNVIDTTNFVTIKNEQTIIAAKTFSDDVTFNVGANSAPIKISNPAFTVGESAYTATTDEISTGLVFKDSANETIGSLQLDASASGPSISMSIQKPTSLQTDDDPSLGLGIENNTIKSFAPNPASGSNSDEIATTSWVTTKISGVNSNKVTTNTAQTVSGAKTFSAVTKSATPAAGSNDTSVATTAWVRSYINSLMKVSATAVAESSLSNGQIVFIPATDSLTKP